MKQTGFLSVRFLVVAALVIAATTGYASEPADVSVRPDPALRLQILPVDSTRADDEYEFGDIQFIHPWDNPQGKDTSQLDGSGTIRAMVTEHDLGLPSEVAGAAKATGEAPRPKQISLLQNYPNPFNAETRIAFVLAEGGSVELSIYNLVGQKVRGVTLSGLAEGRHTWRWDGQTKNGRVAASGVYFYRAESGNAVAINKMVLLK